MIYKLKGIEADTAIEFENADCLVKLSVNKQAVNLSYTEVCDLSNLLDDAKNNMFESAILDLGI